jgi:hypothetical protein
MDRPQLLQMEEIFLFQEQQIRQQPVFIILELLLDMLQLFQQLAMEPFLSTERVEAEQDRIMVWKFQQMEQLLVLKMEI